MTCSLPRPVSLACNCPLSPSRRAFPLLWRRFALFHELYHLLYHTKGARFWQQSFVSMESFENRADTFAWAALWPEWEENQYHDWAEAEPWQC